MQPQSALIIIDLQNDFMPQGAFPVSLGHEIIPIINQLLPYFTCIIATQDWHPLNHKSFANNNPNHSVGDVIDLLGISQILWPTHCVQNTWGAEFVSSLNTRPIQYIIKKGENPSIDSYSGFFDNAYQNSTGLETLLKSLSIENIYLCGLATDYCVLYTALDARQLGFTTYLIQDACRGVNLHKKDIESALNKMEEAGVILINSEQIINRTDK